MWVGLWDGANIFALLLCLAVPFALEFGFGPYPFIYRVISIMATGIVGHAIFLTNSKGGFVTFLGIIFFYFAVKRTSGYAKYFRSLFQVPFCFFENSKY